MELVQALIAEARTEYERHEMDDPVLLDGTSEMHARNALSHLHNRHWDDALKEAEMAAEQRSRWQRFSEIVIKIGELRRK